MQAPSYDVLMDFEGQLSLVFQRVFTLAGLLVPEGIQSSEKIKTPDFLFHFSSGGVADNHRQPVFGQQVYDHYKGVLDVVIYTTRSENTAAEAPLYRARTRTIFLTWRGRFAQADQLGNPLCPYYQILDISERGSSMTVDSGQDMDVTPMHYDVKFNINPDAWPEQLENYNLIQTQNV